MQTIQYEVLKTLEATRLNWKVEKQPLFTGGGLPTPLVGLYKGDTYLGVASPKYQPLQNNELVEALHEAGLNFNLTITKGGELFDGERVYLQFEIDDEYIGNSQVKRYITAMNSHNGKGSVVFGSTNDILNITPSGVSSVKFFQIFRELNKFRHTESVKSRVDNAIKGLFASLKELQNQSALMKKMAECKVEDELLRKILFECYAFDLNAKTSELPTRTANRIEKVKATLVGEVNKQDGSLWGLFQGILKNTEINTPKNKTTDENAYAGGGYAINMKAYNIITQFLKQSGI